MTIPQENPTINVASDAGEVELNPPKKIERGVAPAELSSSPAGSYNAHVWNRLAKGVREEHHTYVIAHPNDIKRLKKGEEGETETDTEILTLEDPQKIAEQGEAIDGVVTARDGDRLVKIDFSGTGYRLFKPATRPVFHEGVISGRKDRGLEIDTKGRSLVLLQRFDKSVSSDNGAEPREDIVVVRQAEVDRRTLKHAFIEAMQADKT